MTIDKRAVLGMAAAAGILAAAAAEAGKPASTQSPIPSGSCGRCRRYRWPIPQTIFAASSK